MAGAMIRPRTSKRLLTMVILAGSIVAACTDGSFSSITSPTPPFATPTPSPTPPTPVPPFPRPGTGTFTLSGRVTETPPTPNTGIGGAIVKIIGGPDAGRSATTNSLGFYSIAGVSAGSTINVSAQGYIEATRNGDEGSNFQLMPVPRTTTTTMSDTLSAQVGTCSDGIAMRPCHILTIAIHNSGPLEATLTWEPGDEPNLDLSLFRTGSPNAIARSALPGDDPEKLSANLPAGATYELHITYASGTSAAKYTLKATHQN